ncbi:SH3 domain-containing protein [Sorangium sp. So ce260]|uniref:SH3 domain-containing protein n=1 Tax=Sorangium sp. So ce260 TaxID=3133291 RepID=UPI003F631A29
MDDSPAGQGASPGPRDVRAAHAGTRLAARAEPPPGAAPAPPRARRLDRLTGLVLLAATAVALLPTAPIVLRAVAGERAPVQGAGRFAHLLEGRSPAGRSPAHLRFPFDEDPGADEPRSPRDDGPAFDEEEEEPGAAARLQLGIASRGITLLEEPRADGARIGAVAAGELVMIVRESGAWALVARNQGDSMVMGWARRSEIAIR